MTILVRVLVLGAVLLFIMVSAAMNAVFLSSLGRTPIEATMLGLVSVASDAAKVALPVVLMRALTLRAWVHAGAAAQVVRRLRTLVEDEASSKNVEANIHARAS